MRLSGHLYQQETTWTEKITSFNVDGPTYQDRPKLRWRDVVNTNLHKKHLNISLAINLNIRPVTQQIALQPTMSGTRR